MTTTQAIQIQELLGLSQVNITFKVVNSPFDVDGTECQGVCLSYDDGSFDVVVCNDEDVLHTLLHELSHVDGNIRGEGRSCVDCDEIADNLLEYVREQL